MQLELIDENIKAYSVSAKLNYENLPRVCATECCYYLLLLLTLLP